MLKEEVVQACKAGQFAVYGIDHVLTKLCPSCWICLRVKSGKDLREKFPGASRKIPCMAIFNHGMQQIKDYEKQEMEEAKAKTETPTEH